MGFVILKPTEILLVIVADMNITWWLGTILFCKRFGSAEWTGMLQREKIFFWQSWRRKRLFSERLSWSIVYCKWSGSSGWPAYCTEDGMVWHSFSFDYPDHPHRKASICQRCLWKFCFANYYLDYPRPMITIPSYPSNYPITQSLSNYLNRPRIDLRRPPMTTNDYQWLSMTIKKTIEKTIKKTI